MKKVYLQPLTALVLFHAGERLMIPKDGSGGERTALDPTASGSGAPLRLDKMYI